MGESNCLDIWSFIIAIVSLCVSIWIGVSAQRFSKKQAKNENEYSEKAFKEMKETNENIKFVKNVLNSLFKGWTQESKDDSSL